MPHILLAVFLLICIGFVVRSILKRRRDPTRRIRRDAKNLCTHILREFPTAQRATAETVLRQTQDHLDALLRAKRNHVLLLGMTHTAETLTQHTPAFTHTHHSISTLDAHIASQLAQILSDLSRLATVVSLSEQDSLLELQTLSDDLELRREALNELSRSLHDQHATHPAPSPQTISSP